MSQTFWEGGTTAVTQVWKGTITTTTNGHTYIVTLTAEDGTTAVFTYTVANPPDTTTTLVATGFINAWNLSEDPLISSITATQSSGQVILTADTAGVPFYAAQSGTGTWTGAGNTTPNEGPNDYNTPDNWSGGAVPVNSDEVTIDARGASYDILYGMNQSAVTLTSLNHYLGAPAVGTTGYALRISATTASLNLPAQGAVGSGVLVNINFGTNAVNCTDYGSTYAGADGLPGTMVAGSHDDNVFTKIAGALTGIGVMTPGQASNFPIINVRGGKLITGSAVTWADSGSANAGTVTVRGGTLTLGKGNTAGTLTYYDGVTTVNGTTKIDTVNANGGVAKFFNGATPIDTLNGNGGEADFGGNTATVADCNVYDGGLAVSGADHVTFTNGIVHSLTRTTKLSISVA